jgi:hypothetical protein
LVPNDGLRSVEAQACLPARAVHGAVGHQGARLVVDRCFERRPKNFNYLIDIISRFYCLNSYFFVLLFFTTVSLPLI